MSHVILQNRLSVKMIIFCLQPIAIDNKGECFESFYLCYLCLLTIYRYNQDKLGADAAEIVWTTLALPWPNQEVCYVPLCCVLCCTRFYRFIISSLIFITLLKYIYIETLQNTAMHLPFSRVVHITQNSVAVSYSPLWYRCRKIYF